MLSKAFDLKAKTKISKDVKREIEKITKIAIQKLENFGNIILCLIIVPKSLRLKLFL